MENNAGSKYLKIKSILTPQYADRIRRRSPYLLPKIFQKFNQADELKFRDKVQRILKRNSKIYNFLVKTFAPVYVNPFMNIRIKTILNSYDETDVVVNLGSGPGAYFGRKDIINIDVYPYESVDVITDGRTLPIKNNSVDLIINTAVLEHVDNPQDMVSEIHRVMKQGGCVLCFVPFLQPYHSAPDDFQRWTATGAKHLFSQFSHADIHIGAGPTSALLWVFQEWIAILLSFGNRFLHDCIFFCVAVITAPFKVLDLFLSHFENSQISASGFYIIARK